jgi:hypothetical protein
MVLDPQLRRFCFTNSSIISQLLAVRFLLASKGRNFLARDLFRIVIEIGRQSFGVAQFYL